MNAFDKADLLGEIAATIEHSDDVREIVKRLRAQRDELYRQVADEHRARLTPEERAKLDAEENY